MLQRVQSIYLAVVFISIAALIKITIWTKTSVDGTCSLCLNAYAVVHSSGQNTLFPYNSSLLLILFMLVFLVYTILRHDNRKLQLQLTTIIHAGLITLMVLLIFFIHKMDGVYFPNGLSNYKIGIVLPFIALVANLLAQHHIRHDERLVKNDNLR